MSRLKELEQIEPRTREVIVYSGDEGYKQHLESEIYGRRLRVSVVYNAFKNISSKENIDYLSEVGVKDEVDAVCGALERLGHEFIVLPVREVAADICKITAFQSSVIFNLCEGYVGTQQEMYIAGLWELLGIPYTGNAPLTLGIAKDKILTKQLMQLHGIPTPDYEIFSGIPHNTNLVYPLIVKPAKEDGSVGVNPNAVVDNLDELRLSVDDLLRKYDQEVLVEQYIDGREFAVALLRDNMPFTLPPSEICFDGLDSALPHIASYESKWIKDSPIFQKTLSVCPAIVDTETQRHLQAIALDMYWLMRGRDYGRVDFRMDKAGNLFVLEYNPNPDISPTAGYVKALKAAGISYDSFVKILLKEAISRKYHIRPLKSEDRPVLLEIIKKTDMFTSSEVNVAIELIDVVLNQKTQKDYIIDVAVDKNENVLGYVCYGPTPATVGTFDLYWIVVDRRFQNQGIGKRLLQFVEGKVADSGGRMILAETSSQEKYLPTRAFYLRNGYTIVAQIKDFYGPGDDRVTFVKYFKPNEE